MGGLSSTARFVRVAGFIAARSDTTQRVKGLAVPDVGWLLTDTRAPLAAAHFAFFTGSSEADVDGAIGDLLTIGAFVRSDEGVWGVVGWWPESARYFTAKGREWRQRKAEAARPAVSQ
jgi:hypothetical protein